MATASALKKLCVFACIVLILPKTYAWNDTTDRWNPREMQYGLLQKELNRYFEMQTRGGWPKITISKNYYMKGESAPAIRQIKQRLYACGDFNSNDTSQLFSPELEAAVMRSQKRFGLKENGVVDRQLIKELNVPVEERIQQLEANMERLSSLPPAVEGTRLVANIPEYKLHVYEGTEHVFDMDIVVGKESNQTVVFNDEMSHIVFSPCWNVPPSIVQNEILPAMRRSSTYLRRNGYVQTGTENGLPVIKQLPGANNSLGQVKFVFPNSHNIYFHDTPSKSLFQFQKRAFSHGCIRLAEPAKLAAYLLRNKPGWNEGTIREAMESGKEQTVLLDKAVAVSIIYFTAWVDDNGFLYFRDDIYGHDKKTSGNVSRVAKL